MKAVLFQSLVHEFNWHFFSRSQLNILPHNQWFESIKLDLNTPLFSLLVQVFAKSASDSLQIVESPKVGWQVIDLYLERDLIREGR